MLLKHFFIGKIAHSSYILAGKKSCAVIDPQRDVDIYIREARSAGVAVTHIIETHLHADFISGHMDLAKKTGAKIYAPASAGCKFNHVPLKEGDTVELEEMRLDVLETPGHTPEHVSYVVTDTSRGDTPAGVFTGDALFVGDVGRPDLFPDIAQELAGKLYHSLHDKLLKLPDYCEVYPAHGAGSLCGRSISSKYQTTIGYERRYNSALTISQKQDFIKSLTSNMPPAPDHFSRCSDINRGGPALVSSLPVLEELKPSEFRERLNSPDTEIIDIRDYPSFASMHIPGSWHLSTKGNFPTFAGWVLPVDRDFLIVADDYESAMQANTWARRVGVDRVIGCLDGGMTAWANAGYKTAEVNVISAEDLHDMATGSERIVLVDVRAPGEFNNSHIEGAVNIPAPDLRERYRELNPEKAVTLICSSGARASLAASILQRNGFRKLNVVAGGMAGYSSAGYVKKCTVCENPHGSRYFADET